MAAGKASLDSDGPCEAEMQRGVAWARRSWRFGQRETGSGGWVPSEPCDYDCAGPTTGIWVCVGGETLSKIRNPDQIWGVGEPRCPRQRWRERKGISSQKGRQPPRNKHCLSQERVKEHHLQSSRGGKVNYRVSGDAQSPRRALSPAPLGAWREAV